MLCAPALEIGGTVGQPPGRTDFGGHIRDDFLDQLMTSAEFPEMDGLLGLFDAGLEAALSKPDRNRSKEQT